MSEQVLVTGGTGYVGAWVIVEALRAGYRVRATVRSADKDRVVRDAVATRGLPTDALTTVVADLNADRGWDEAVDGCAYVLHVASPMGGTGEPEHALVAGARDGTLRVLRAARSAGVKRVVLTSSLAAATPVASDGVGDESVWTDPTRTDLDGYRRSKAIAERAAWDLMAEASGTTLTTLLPGAILGPVLRPDQTGSVQVIGRMLAGRPPAVPKIALAITDVRDLAALHVRAMTAPEAAGERFVVVGERLWMGEVAGILRSALGSRGATVPSRVAPDVLVRVASWFLPGLRALLPMLGQDRRFSADKARRMLGWSPRPAAETVVACAESLLAVGGSSGV